MKTEFYCLFVEIAAKCKAFFTLRGRAILLRITSLIAFAVFCYGVTLLCLFSLTTPRNSLPLRQAVAEGKTIEIKDIRLAFVLSTTQSIVYAKKNDTLEPHRIDICRGLNESDSAIVIKDDLKPGERMWARVTMAPVQSFCTRGQVSAATLHIHQADELRGGVYTDTPPQKLQPLR